MLDAIICLCFVTVRTHKHTTFNKWQHVPSRGSPCQNNKMRYKHSMIIMLLKGSD